MSGYSEMRFNVRDTGSDVDFVPVQDVKVLFDSEKLLHRMLNRE
jgi:hypothetical protein